MASVGPVTGTTATTGGGSGTAWTSPSNALTNNASNATAALAMGETSEYLRVVGFGDSLGAIADGDTIDGIEVFIEAAASTGNLFAHVVQLTKDGTTRVGDDLATGDPDGNHTLGGATELWGTTWTAAEVKASTFGVHTRCSTPGGAGGGGTYAIDVITVTVYYTVASTGQPTVKRYETWAKSGATRIGRTTPW